VIDAGVFDSAQIVYNMLIIRCRGIAGKLPGADYAKLSITPARPALGWSHPRAGRRRSIGLGRATSDRKSSAGADRFCHELRCRYRSRRRLMPLVEEGFAGSLTEAATRFALSHPAMGTILVGMAAPQEFEGAFAAVEKGPLPQAALDRLSTLRQHSPASHGDWLDDLRTRMVASATYAEFLREQLAPLGASPCDACSARAACSATP